MAQRWRSSAMMHHDAATLVSRRPLLRRTIVRDVLTCLCDGGHQSQAVALVSRWLAAALPHAGCAILAHDAEADVIELVAGGPAVPVSDPSLAATLAAAGAMVDLEPARPLRATARGDLWLAPISRRGGVLLSLVLSFPEPRAPTRRERRAVAGALHLLKLADRHQCVIDGLEQSSARLDAALSNVRQGLCFFDRSRRLIIANGRYSEIYRLPPGVVRAGITLAEIVALREDAGTGPSMKSENYLAWRNEVQDSKVPSDTEFELSDGRFVAVHHRPMPDGGWVATHEDITERRRAEAHIRHLANHDSLTGLANRLVFHARLAEATAPDGPGAPNGPGCAVVIIDLDRFKAVNDSHGHSAGDELLMAVAARLRACIRDSDTITRLGGDEFAILLVGMGQRDQIALLARRVQTSLCRPYEIGGKRVAIGATLGIAVAPEDGSDPEVLLRNADLALYKSKASQRGTIRFFDSEMIARLNRRTRREGELRVAVAATQFELEYQPLVTLADGTTAGFEALLRWRHPTEGRVLPGDFIPVAEDTGLIVPIGAWVLEEACMAAMAWPSTISVAVNLSAVQFTDASILGAIDTALARSGLAARRLELEITESVLLSDTPLVLTLLHQIRARGVRVSLDDFGTGQSSLSHVQAFPFDKIKIDRSFVRNIGERRESRAVVRAIGGLGHSLQVRTTAEGIETEAQLAMVRAEGCTEGQGYLFSRPMPKQAVAAYLREARVPVPDQVIF